MRVGARRRLATMIGAWLATGASTVGVSAQEPVAVRTADGARLSADLYGDGRGERGVVLAHGGRFDKASWRAQALALAGAGFRVLAIDFRGYGASRGPGDDDPLSAPLHEDVLAAVRRLREAGVRHVSVVGGSMGGAAAARAASAAPGEIERLVLLGSDAGPTPERLRGRTLFIVARGDTTASGTPRLVAIRSAYERTPEPKELLVLEGAAHAQFLFGTPEGARAMGAIERFLLAP